MVVQLEVVDGWGKRTRVVVGIYKAVSNGGLAKSIAIGGLVKSEKG